MGAFDDRANITVPDPERPASEEYRKDHGESATEEQEYRTKWKWDAGEQVILKGEYLAGDHEAVQNANSPAARAKEGKNQEVSARIGSGHIKILERMIVGWTFTRNGRPVELSAANIRRLPSNYLTPLLARCDEISVGMTEEEQEDFFARLERAYEGTLEDDEITPDVIVRRELYRTFGGRSEYRKTPMWEVEEERARIIAEHRVKARKHAEVEEKLAEQEAEARRG